MKEGAPSHTKGEGAFDKEINMPLENKDQLVSALHDVIFNRKKMQEVINDPRFLQFFKDLQTPFNFLTEILKKTIDENKALVFTQFLSYLEKEFIEGFLNSLFEESNFSYLFKNPERPRTPEMLNAIAGITIRHNHLNFFEKFLNTCKDDFIQKLARLLLENPKCAYLFEDLNKRSILQVFIKKALEQNHPDFFDALLSKCSQGFIAKFRQNIFFMAIQSIKKNANHNGIIKILENLCARGVDINFKYNGQSILEILCTNIEKEDEKIPYISFLLNKGALANDSSLDLLFHLAIKFDNRNLIDSLCKKYKQKFRNAFDHDADLWSSLFRRLEKNPNLLTKLLELDLFALDQKPIYGNNPNILLYELVRILTPDNFLRLIQHKKIDINEPCQDNKTFLFSAIENNRPEMVKKLIEFGARINIYDQNNRTPLLVAMQKENFPMIELLIYYGANTQDQQLWNSKGKELLNEIINGPFEELTLTRELFDIVCNKRKNSLLTQEEKLDLIIKNPKFPPLFNKLQETGQNRVLKSLIKTAIEKNNPKIFKKLFDQCHNNFKNQHSQDLFYEACTNIENINTDERIKILEHLHSEINVNHAYEGITVLNELSFRIENNCIPYLIFLLEKGAVLSVQKDEEEREEEENNVLSALLHLAFQNIYFISFLKERFAEKLKEILATNECLNTLLFKQIKRNEIQILKILLDKELVTLDQKRFNEKENDPEETVILSEIEKEDDDEETTVLYEAAKYLDGKNFLSLLENTYSGNYINNRYQQNRTPIFAAIENQNVETLEVLVGLGAQINISDAKRSTPLLLAVQKQDIRMVNFLIKNGAKIDDPRLRTYATPAIRELLHKESPSFSENENTFFQNKKVKRVEGPITKSYTRVISLKSSP